MKIQKKCLKALALSIVLAITGSFAPAAEMTGSDPKNRPYTDFSPGRLYIYTGGHLASDVRVSKFFWFGDGFSGTRVMTPLLFEETEEGVFAVRGIGYGRRVASDSKTQIFNFGLLHGTDVTTNDKFTFGFINALVDSDGRPTYRSAGTVDYSRTYGSTPGLGGYTTTNDWMLTQNFLDLSTAPGTTYGVVGTDARFPLYRRDPGELRLMWYFPGQESDTRSYSAAVSTVSAKTSPEPIEPSPETLTVSVAELFDLADGDYDEIRVEGLENDEGDVLLQWVEVTAGGIFVGGGKVLYYAGMSDVIGNTFTVETGESDNDGLLLETFFKIPDILGGSSTQFRFRITRDNRLRPVSMRIDIPTTVQKGAFTIERAYIEIDTEENKVEGGGFFAPDGVTPTIGGWLGLKGGIGSAVNGLPSMDVVKFGLGKSSLNYPIGSTGAFLDYIGAYIENDYGLSDPDNWDRSCLSGEFDIVLGQSVPIAGHNIAPYDFFGHGTWNIHDGSFDFSGSGKLLNAVETSAVRLQYRPPFEITADGWFDALGIYTGKMRLSLKDGLLAGALNGRLQIPDDIPVIGGMRLADVDASLSGTCFRGTASVELIPGIPEICVPEVCTRVPPCVYLCWPSWCSTWWGGYPCTDCGTKCGPEICTPAFCTPAVPPVTADFGFSFDMQSGSFDFDLFSVPVEKEKAPKDSGGKFTFLTNWRVLKQMPENNPAARRSPMSTGDRYAAGDNPASEQFVLDQSAPGLLFRVGFNAGDVTSVPMHVTLPGGDVLDTAEGPLPGGYEIHSGYSRFNPKAFEQVIVVIDPAPGTYTVTVDNPADLGEITINAMIQNKSPDGGITSVRTGPEAGQYQIDWWVADLETLPTVHLELDADRDGYDGFRVAAMDTADGGGTYILETQNLDLPGDHYFVTLVIEDGVNAPVHRVSDTWIEVVPNGRPAPVTHLQYYPGDGGFQLQWTAGSAETVTGYLIQWTEDAEDPGTFDRQTWIPDTGNGRPTAVVDGLVNGVPVLVRVLAVGTDGGRSASSEILRIVPQRIGENHAPRITSLPDEDATAGWAYAYAPMLEDVDPSESYAWRLTRGPSGMTVDAASGLLCWTPAAVQAGNHEVTLQVVEILPNGNTAEAEQAFQIHVYPPDQIQGLEAHLYRLCSPPLRNTWENTTYQYQPVVHGPEGGSIRFELLAGPAGMCIDPDSGQVAWTVPAGAEGTWVRIKAIAEEMYAVYQDYYLFVQRNDQLLPQMSAQNDLGFWDVAVNENQPLVILNEFTVGDGLVFSVNGIAGGSAEFGTINEYGVFTAPASIPDPPTVTVTMERRLYGGGTEFLDMATINITEANLPAADALGPVFSDKGNQAAAWVWNVTTSSRTEVTHADLCLNTADDIDALSFGDAPAIFNKRRRAFFIVDRNAAGASGDVAARVAAQNPIQRDLYVEDTTGAGNALCIADLPGLGGAAGADADDIDAFDFGDRGLRTGVRLYFSLTADSPTLSTNGWGSGDVLTVLYQVPGTLERYAAAADIGAPADIDALSIHDLNLDNVYQPSADYIIYSAGAAAGVMHYGFGAPVGTGGFAGGHALFGLLDTDDIVALAHKTLPRCTDTDRNGSPDLGDAVYILQMLTGLRN